MAPGQPESDRVKEPGNREKVLNGSAWLASAANADKQQEIVLPCSCQLCGVVAFLLLSVVSFSLAAKFPAPTEQLRALLGPSPPELYLNIAFAAYIISEFFYIILRTGDDGSRKFAVKQLLFYSGFYLFFWYAGMLQGHIVLLVVSGATLQVMESFRRVLSCKTAKQAA